MKWFKIVVIVTLTLVSLTLLTAIFLPRSLKVSESMQFQTLPKLVFRQVSITKNRDTWYPFVSKETVTVSGIEGGAANEAGKRPFRKTSYPVGSLTTIESRPYSFILNRISCNGGNTLYDEWHFVENQDGVHVRWSITIDNLGYPTGRISGLFLPGYFKGLMKEGLDNLQFIAKGNQLPYEIMEVEMEPVSALCITGSGYFAHWDSIFQGNCSLLETHAQLTGLDIAGKPFAVFEDFIDNTSMNFRICLPVWDRELRESGRFLLYEYPGGNAIMATHYGHSASIKLVHDELKLYAAEFQIPLEGVSFEVYLKGRFDDEPSDNWITEVIYPVSVIE
jgi:effector-binding domain-containing protein